MQSLKLYCARAALLMAVATILGNAQTPPGPGRGRGGFGMGLISRDTPDPAAVERGTASFVATCGFCHGRNANGGESGPDLIRSAVALDDEKGDKIGPIIRQGRPAGGMPAFPQMTDAQIQDIAAFLRARQQAAINRGSYQILNLNTGDQKKGEAWFAAHCVGCHSVNGDLAHVASKYQPEALIGRILYPGGRGGRGGRGGSAATRPTATVTTASGKAFSGALEYRDDFDIGLRDSSGLYHSFALAPGVKVQIDDPLAKHEEMLKKYSDAELHDILAYLETLK
jgi:mono/diheme cytochrome c family protein